MDRNFHVRNPTSTRPRSLSARRAWIEISALACSAGFVLVALRKESVDRNNFGRTDGTRIYWSLSARRAWIEIAKIVFVPLVNGSLSARRAWIEMRMALFLAPAIMVALRKESVDRNRRQALKLTIGFTSLSARRAWIEILMYS